jgi:DNA (cytosine-5)-methyltransferase 1
MTFGGTGELALQQCSDSGLRELSLFAGAGGGILGGVLLGWQTVCAVEIDSFCARRLMQRQNEGHLPPFPIWDDVRTFDGLPWTNLVDVVSGGFPCQDISAAGCGAGISGARSGLWGEMARVVREVRPRFVFVENSPLLTSRGLDRVLGDLAALGFDARWGVFSAAECGAPHLRKRLWIVANADSQHLRILSRQGSREERTEESPVAGDNGEEKPVADANDPWQLQQERRGGQEREWVGDSGTLRNPTSARLDLGTAQALRTENTKTQSQRSNWWAVEPAVDRVAHGVANRVDRLRALGNGQVPAVAARAWRTLRHP